MAGFDATQLAAVGSVGGTAIAAFCIHWLSERRAKKKDVGEAGGAAVVAATVISDVAIDKLIKVTREAAESHHDDCRRIRESSDDLRDAMRDLERAVRDGLPPAAGVDIAGVMARLNRLEGRP